MPCGDAKDDLACKEALLLDRAIGRAREVDAQWLSVGQDDKYVWTKSVARALASLDSSVPQVIANFGCAQAWEYNEDSKNGTLPPPIGWVNPRHTCDAVWKHGSICGGPTYFVSRGALEILRKPDESQVEFIEKFIAPTKPLGRMSDVAASCMYYDRGIPIRVDHDIVRRMLPVVAAELKDGIDAYVSHFKLAHREAPLTMHLDIGYDPALTKDDVPGLIEKLRPLYPGSLLQENGMNFESSAFDSDQATDEGLEFQFATLKASFLYGMHKHKDWTPVQ